MHCPELWIVVNFGGSSSAQDTDKADVSKILDQTITLYVLICNSPLHIHERIEPKAAFDDCPTFHRSDEFGNTSTVKIISRNFLQTVDDVFFRLPFASVEDMNKALQEARVTEQDMAAFTARLHSDHDNKNARAHLQTG
jgi:hypothetical protein